MGPGTDGTGSDRLKIMSQDISTIMSIRIRFTTKQEANATDSVGPGRLSVVGHATLHQL